MEDEEDEEEGTDGDNAMAITQISVEKKEGKKEGRKE